MISKHILNAIIFLIINIIEQGSNQELQLGKIVRGVDAEIGEIPYQVSLRIDGRHHCGGTIIGQKHILTAAHCYFGIIPESSMMRATVLSGTVMRTGGGEIHNIEKIVRHPDYVHKPPYSHDISVITLKDQIAENSVQRAVSLPTSETPGGVEATVAGWGTISHPGSLATNLQKLPVNILTMQQCKSRRFFKDFDHNRILCTESLSRRGGDCLGDSGGGVVYNNSVYGVVSRVVPCAQGFPDVNTRVFPYLDFIKNAMMS